MQEVAALMAKASKEEGVRGGCSAIWLSQSRNAVAAARERVLRAHLELAERQRSEEDVQHRAEDEGQGTAKHGGCRQRKAERLGRCRAAAAVAVESCSGRKVRCSGSRRCRR